MRANSPFPSLPSRREIAVLGAITRQLIAPGQLCKKCFVTWPGVHAAPPSRLGDFAKFQLRQSQLCRNTKDRKSQLA